MGKPKHRQSKHDTTHTSPVVQGVHRFLRRQTRHIRIQITLNPDEHNALKAAAATADTTLAQWVRASSMWATALYLNERQIKPPKANEDE